MSTVEAALLDERREKATQRHEWTMSLAYAISDAAAEEMMTGQRPEREEDRDWRPTRDRLLRITGPECLACGVLWGTQARQPCLGKPGKGLPRAERRRAERAQAKRGKAATIENGALSALVDGASQTRVVQSAVDVAIRQTKHG